MKKKIVLIGLGNIGMMYDFKKSKSSILTYAKAIKQSKKLEFVGAVDISKKQRELFEGKYKVKSFSSTKKLLQKIDPDIIIISTPTKTHSKIISDIMIKKKNIFIICEKPLTENLQKISKIKRLTEKNNIKIFTNYMRLVDPKVLYLKNIIKFSKKSNFFCEIFYNGTLLNNCSHYISLMIYFFGNEYKLKILNRRKNYFDFKLIFQNSEVYFYSSTIRNIQYEDIRLINKRFIFSYRNGGKELVKEKAVNNSIYGIGKHYIPSMKIADNFYKYSQKFVIKEIENLFLKNKKNLMGDISHAKDVQYLIKKIYEKKL